MNYEHIIQAVSDEVVAQDIAWGVHDCPNGTGGDEYVELAAQCKRLTDLAFRNKRGTWRHILLDTMYDALAQSDDQKLYDKLIESAAVAVRWAEAVHSAESTRQDQNYDDDE